MGYYRLDAFIAFETLHISGSRRGRRRQTKKRRQKKYISHEFLLTGDGSAYFNQISHLPLVVDLSLARLLISFIRSFSFSFRFLLHLFIYFVLLFFSISLLLIIAQQRSNINIYENFAIKSSMESRYDRSLKVSKDGKEFSIHFFFNFITIIIIIIIINGINIIIIIIPLPLS